MSSHLYYVVVLDEDFPERELPLEPFERHDLAEAYALGLKRAGIVDANVFSFDSDADLLAGDRDEPDDAAGASREAHEALPVAPSAPEWEQEALPEPYREGLVERVDAYLSAGSASVAEIVSHVVSGYIPGAIAYRYQLASVGVSERRRLKKTDSGTVMSLGRFALAERALREGCAAGRYVADANERYSLAPPDGL